MIVTEMELRDRIQVSPELFRLVSRIALFAVAVIIVTGAAVRLTGSGLGCPDWPKCYGQYIAPGKTPAVIEYSNRVVTGLVSIATITAAIMGWFRRPYRRELQILAILLPIGVMAQAILGAIVVGEELVWWTVSLHFVLSMLLMDAAFALAWCATYDPGDRPRAKDRLGVWSVRALLPIGVTTMTLGALTTAAGPHTGAGRTGETVHRLTIFGSDTLSNTVFGHGTAAVIFGLSVIATILVLRRPGGETRALKPLFVVLGLLTTQGVIGLVQWQQELPSLLVWFHVLLVVLTWLAVLWSIGAAGLLEGEFERSSREPAAQTEG